jgi:catecholate siderophore receptor
LLKTVAEAAEELYDGGMLSHLSCNYLGAALACWIAAAPLVASPEPAPPARLSVRILDPAGAVIAGARLAAAPGGGAHAEECITGRDGQCSLTLRAGAYQLRVSAPGFLELAEPLQLEPGAQLVREYVLEIAAVRESVTVVESADYRVQAVTTATRTPTPLENVPQAVTVVPSELMRDQLMMSLADVVRYVPGVTAVQGENNRDQLVIRGNNTSADFFLDGVRDDVQYFRDLYNLERVEALKGPNAMIFGRGGGGGVVNRVTKTADFNPFRELALVGGSWRQRRLAADVDQPVSARAAARLNAMYEQSDSFRNFVDLERFGLNPTLTLAPSPASRLLVGYEHFRDDRRADRGIPSFQGRPAEVGMATFFGDPDQSWVRARVHLGSIAAERQFGLLNLRNRTLIGDYDRGYQNFVPGAVSADGAEVSLTAYNSSTARRNLFNQTDLIATTWSGAVRHTLLAGAEFGRQATDNFRNTGYFENHLTSVRRPLADPLLRLPVTFRQNAADPDNHVVAVVAAAYFQDQIELSRRWQAVVGLRADRFDLDYHDRRTGQRLGRLDYLVSPRAGLVFKPAEVVSLYTSYSVSYLPSSGDQFSSLTAVTQQLKPEKFTNYEAGLKWDPARKLSLTAALYRLDRTNTRAVDPNDPSRIVQTGSQRSEGLEVGWSGAPTRSWVIAGGYAWQNAFVTRATIDARAGARVAQAPRHSFSFWNRYQFRPRWSAGLGVVSRTEMFAGIDNTVILPGYARLDAALYHWLTERVRLQVNVENLLDRKYWANAHNNNNISPGAPRAIRVGLVAHF